jgi:outer membrane immunogenic protein
VFTLTPVAGSASSTTTRVGWTIGARIEGVVSGNWTARLEYLYVDLGDVSVAFFTLVTGLSGGLLTSRYSSHITVGRAGELPTIAERSSPWGR